MIKNPSSARPGRPREFDSDTALDKAIIRFSEHGYHGTSISDLNACLGLTSGSIYKAWGDKRGLFLAALDRYTASRAEAINARLAAERTGRDRVKALLDVYALLSSEAEGRTGCLVIETVVELSMADAQIAERIAAQQRVRETQLRRLIEEGQQEGSVGKAVDAAVTAKLLLTFQQGMRVMGKTGATKEQMQGLVSQIMRLLD